MINKKEKNEIKEGFFDEKDFISPSYINLNNPRFLEIDDYFYSGITIVNYYREYNDLILKSLIETSINMNISVFYEKKETSKVIKELTYNIGNVGVELKQSNESRQDIDIAAFTYNDAKYIRKELQINNEDMYFLYIYLTLFSTNKKELEYNLDKIEGILQSKGLQTRRTNFRQEQLFIFDFEGFVDGEPFQGGKGEDYSLVIGSHSFIDTFEDQLVGKKAGEEVDVNVTFPEEYHEASLKGKPALFKVTVKEIKKKELPKLDDEFASEVSEFETLKEYKASVKKNLTERRKEEAKREKENEVVEKVVENITVELPEPMVDEQTQQMIQEFAGRLSSQGLSFDQYMQMTGMTVDALMGQMKPEAEKRIRTRLALEAIVDAEKIKATAKDIDKEIENMANMYQMEVDKIKEMIGDAEKEQIGKDLAVQKAVDFVVKNAVEVEPAEEDKEEK